MNVPEAFLGRHHAETLSGNMHGWPSIDLLDSEDLQWVAVEADRFDIVSGVIAFQAGHVPRFVGLRDIGLPTVEVFLIPQRSPTFFRVQRTASDARAKYQGEVTIHC